MEAKATSMDATALTRTSAISCMADVPSASVKKLEQCAATIDKLRGKTIELIFATGVELKKAHGVLANHGDGTFGRWCKECCGITYRSARNYLNVIDAFEGQVSERLSQSFTAESLYFLSRDSTPQDAIDAAIKAADSGERITLQKAKEIIGHVIDVEPESVTEVDVEEEEEEEDEPEYTTNSFSPAASLIVSTAQSAFAGWPKEWWPDIDAIFQNLLKQDKSTWKKH